MVDKKFARIVAVEPAVNAVVVAAPRRLILGRRDVNAMLIHEVQRSYDALIISIEAVLYS